MTRNYNNINEYLVALYSLLFLVYSFDTWLQSMIFLQSLTRPLLILEVDTMSHFEMTVQSEIYTETHCFGSKYEAASCKSNVVTAFPFRHPSDFIENGEPSVETDTDGDLIVSRKKKHSEGVIKIEHSVSTPIKLVGLQVWRGALLLADFVIYNGKSHFHNKTVMELGSGVGLTSIAAAMFAKCVVCTDIDLGGILDLIKSNAALNAHLVKSDFTVMAMDFLSLEWSEELIHKIKETDIFLAADVIYDNDLTESFVNTLTRILQMPYKKTVYIALERRYVFTVADLDTVAPCYEYFLQYLDQTWSHPPMSLWKREQLLLDFPQYFHYDRVNHLVLWRISN